MVKEVWVLLDLRHIKWVRERIIPPNRQNISSILHELGMKEYSEIGMLVAYKGSRCQDDMWIEEVTEGI